MADKFMHVIEGKAVSNYYKNYVFIHHEPVTGNTLLCKLMQIDESSGSHVYVYYFRANLQRWSEVPYSVPCDELRWYKKPNFTADDLLK